MTPQEALAQALLCDTCEMFPHSPQCPNDTLDREQAAAAILDALPEGWRVHDERVCGYVPVVCSEAYERGVTDGAQQERERLRAGLMKVALADGWPHDWWERADSQVLADPEDDR